MEKGSIGSGIARSTARQVVFFYLLGLILLMGCFTFQTAHAVLHSGEPTYCEPKNFKQYQIPLKGVSISRLKAFQLGRVVIAGMAIGNTDAVKVKELYQKLKSSEFGDRHCTWYVNKGNNAAEKVFKHHYLPNPSGLDEIEGPQVYMKEMDAEFSSSPESFVTCADQAGYIGLGCNGQRHRGPTVFGMLLAYSGCSPQNSATIVNELWGLNGVKPEVRKEIIQAAYVKGSQQSDFRQRMQELFLSPSPR